jgi:hypothetical protein
MVLRHWKTAIGIFCDTWTSFYPHMNENHNMNIVDTMDD